MPSKRLVDLVIDTRKDQVIFTVEDYYLWKFALSVQQSSTVVMSVFPICETRIIFYKNVIASLSSRLSYADKK